MNELQTFTAGLQCTLSELQMRNIHQAEAAPLEKADPFQLSLKVTFSDTSDGHLISLLLPLGLAIRVNFSARSYSGPSPELDLGHVTLTTVADVFEYTPTLVIAGGPAAIGLDANAVYQIKAMVRVGHAPFSIPTLGRGFINGLDLPVGQPAVVATKSEPVVVTEGVTEIEAVKATRAATSTRTRTPRSKSLKP